MSLTGVLSKPFLYITVPGLVILECAVDFSLCFAALAPSYLFFQSLRVLTVEANFAPCFFFFFFLFSGCVVLRSEKSSVRDCHLECPFC